MLRWIEERQQFAVESCLVAASATYRGAWKIGRFFGRPPAPRNEFAVSLVWR